MQNHTRNYWWLNANPTHWSFDSFNPGEDAFYWNANPDGSPRKVQSNFEKVAIGDLVVGYSTTPDKVIKCLCQIVEPNDGKKFTIRKLLDLPVPIRQSEWSKLPAFKTFQYRGTLYQLDNGQWNALASLIRKRNPSARLPFSEKTYTLRGLFAEMMASPYTTWHDNFKEAFARFSKKEPLSEADLRALVFEKSNGIASAGQSVITNDFYKTLSSDSRFLNALRDFRAQLSASSFHHLADICDSLAEENNHRKFRLKVNRIASALTTSVSAVPDEYAFGKVLQWLKERNLLGFEPGGNDCWFEDNQQLVSMLDRELSDVKGYDVWYRNIFPWWIYEELIKNGTSFVYNPPTHSMKQSLNTILYGPPGTGKTYNTADYAVAIIEGKSVEDIQQESHDEVHKRFLGYKEQKRIAFTTFHQSYGYEDFIEGIRPVLDDESEETSEVRYELHDGIFKEFCKRAAEAKAVERDDYDIRTGASVWKVSLERTGDNKTRKDCLKNGYIRIGWDEYGPDITDETFKNSASGKTVLKAFIDRMQIGDVVVSCWSANETDAIGVVTGDYEWHDEFAEYKRLRKVNWLWVAKDEKENIRKINHDCGMVLSTVYRLKIDLPDILSLVHKHRSKNAPLQNDASPCVFVIDEINRGNISKIFGELITLVEPSKRLGAAEETKAKLPYSGDDFGVPSNVYILGTMNTADRSIALLDTALRRRFEFVEMMPNPELLADIHVGDTGIDLKAMLQRMNDRIEFLLDREHTIGHAYFLGDFKDHPTLAGLAEIFRNKIVPLLQEYFFDDYSKIRLVLGDNGKKENAVQFFNEKNSDDVFFGNAEDAVDPDRCVYRINEEAFDNPAAYIGIYDEKTA